MKRREAIKRTVLASGYALSATAIVGVMNGCQAETSSDWKPSFLSEEQGNTLIELTEAIIPKTDTPGANDVGVHQFIDQLLNECLSEKEQVLFTRGLDQLQSDCKAKFKKSFAETSNVQKKEVLDEYDKAAYAANSSQGGDRPFFTMAKQLTYLGYFTSKAVGTEVLRYDPIPSAYNGCIPYENGDRAWSI